MLGLNQLVGFMCAPAAGDPVIGSAFGGGFYTGKISTAGNGVADYYLVVAPKDTGESFGVWGPYDVTTGATSVINGKANTDTLAALTGSYPAADFCDALTIGGFTDWYLPASMELNVVYYHLKPGTSSNSTSDGSNAYAVLPQPISTNYSAGAPAQTSVTAFQTGGSEVFIADMYFTSVETSSINQRALNFNDGSVSAPEKYYASCYFRAIRKVAIV